MDRRKAIVRDSYDAIADAWGQERRGAPADARERAREHAWLERFAGSLKAAARVLDLGCGNGAPILAGLVARGYQVTGVDFSTAQVMQARARCPAATVLEADLAEVMFEAASFDGVIAYDSIWHTPREEHARIFARMRPWIVDGGTVLLTLGAVKEATGDGLFTQLCGAPIFYDAWPAETSFALLRTAGFTILDHHLQPSRPDGGGHLIVFARAS